MKKLTFLLIITTYTLFALVSIKPVEISDNPGWSGKAEASLETKRGNTHKDNYKSSLRITYDNNNTYVTWTEVSSEYGKSNNTEDTNKAFAHLRYIHSLYFNNLRSEFFLQSQDDKFKLIKRRRLAGAGVRYKLFTLFENDKGYLGLGAFYENIEYTSNDPRESNARLNSYFAYTTPFGKTSSLTYTFYYQPIYNYFNDFVLTHSFELKVHVYEKLFLKLSVDYDLDSKPPMGVTRDDFTQTTSFLYNF